MKSKLITDVTTLTKNQFVVVKIMEEWFEIGKFREAQLRGEGPPQRTILLLTKAQFPTNPPYFDKNWTPFLIDPNNEEPLTKYQLFTIDKLYVKILLDQQKSYLEMVPERRLELLAFIETKAHLLNEQEILRYL